MPELIATLALVPHAGEVAIGDGLTAAWLLVVGAVYARGITTLWRNAGRGRGVSRGSAAAFYAGLAAVAAAVLGPLDHAADELFAAHMVQHLLLILVAAPLFVVGVPEIAVAWALPSRSRRWLRPLAHVRAGSAGGSLIVLLVATATLWLWHAPALYDAAVRDARLHALEHASFLATAWLFWWSVLRMRGARLLHGLRVLYVFAMAVQGALLGALLTFAARPIYRAHLDTTAAWGITPLEDQRLAGAIMWVPPGILYTAVAAILLVRFLSERARTAVEAPAAAGQEMA